MQLDLNIIKDILENHFIEDYKIIKNYVININKILKEYDIPEYTYNEFCIIFEKRVINYIKEQNQVYITPKELKNILNKILKDKITNKK